MEADEPWQALSCCVEITKALRNSEGAAKYMSGYPVHQDGSCNGLQHYAALGRDQAGAYSVNLMPSNEPQDVYSTVASLVEKARSEDAINNVPIAIVLDGFIKRKVISILKLKIYQKFVFIKINSILGDKTNCDDNSVWSYPFWC